MAHQARSLAFLFIITTCVAFCGPAQNAVAASAGTVLPARAPAHSAGGANDLYRGTWVINIAPPTNLPVSDPERLARLCTKPGPVYACTKLVAPVLTGRCRRAAHSWFIDARAQLRPEMLMRNASYLKHELRHMIDIRERLALHLEELVTRRFDTQASCLRAEGIAIAAFPRLMHSLASESTDAIDRPLTLRAAR